MGEKINSSTPRCERSTIPDPNIRIRQQFNTNSPIFNSGHSQNNQYYHFPSQSERIINIANNYYNQDIIEVTPNEYASLSDEDKERTQVAFLSEFGPMYRDAAWCALTMSKFAKEAGMDIGDWPKAQVSQFIDWAKANDRYRPIKTKPFKQGNNDPTANSVNHERNNRCTEIYNQIKNGEIKPGDFIIWKSDTAIKDGDKWVIKQASHIGLVESVDKGNGTITIIEGNANVPLFDANGERIIARTPEQCINGNQEIGEVMEQHRHDGIRKITYNIGALANMGYSGYIDNSSAHYDMAST